MIQQLKRVKCRNKGLDYAELRSRRFTRWDKICLSSSTNVVYAIRVGATWKGFEASTGFSFNARNEKDDGGGGGGKLKLVKRKEEGKEREGVQSVRGQSGY